MHKRGSTAALTSQKGTPRRGGPTKSNKCNDSFGGATKGPSRVSAQPSTNSMAGSRHSNDSMSELPIRATPLPLGKSNTQVSDQPQTEEMKAEEGRQEAVKLLEERRQKRAELAKKQKARKKGLIKTIREYIGNFLDEVPEQIALRIFVYIDPPDVVHCAMVCRQWRWFVNRWEIWKVQTLKQDWLVPEPIRSYSGDFDWKQFYLEMEHTNVLVWGHNWHGQLGVGGQENSHTPEPVDRLDGLAPKSVCAGPLHTAIITHSGAVYTMGRNSHNQLGYATQRQDSTVPKRVPLNVFITQVACGMEHTLFLSYDCTVYSVGRGEYGGLGHDSFAPLSTPKPIEKLSDGGAKAIAAGGSSSACIYFNGDLFVWGRNDFGQLGLHDMCSRNRPTKVKSSVYLEDKPVRAVAMGYRHSLLLVGDIENGDRKVYSCGAGEAGQLGLGSTVDWSEFQEVEVLRTMEIVSVDAGMDHSGALSKSGDALFWGSGKSYQLYNGASQNILVPDIPEALSNRPVKEISLGGYHSAVVTTGGQLLLSGLGDSGELGTISALQSITDDTGEIHGNTCVDPLTYGLVIKDVSLGMSHSCVIMHPVIRPARIDCGGENTTLPSLLHLRKSRETNQALGGKPSER